MQEFELLRQYLKANKIKAIKTAGGSYVEMITAGKGARVDSGKYVSILYTGRTLAGVVFDSNTDPHFGHTEPLSFTTGINEMIAGFDEGMQLLKVGAKARIYIPSSQAYGKTGIPPGIQPFETLVYDVEVLSLANKPVSIPPGTEN